MVLHLIKLAVGIDSLFHLRTVHQERAARFGGTTFTETRATPRRGDELLDGGSLYWVIKGKTAARQPVLGLDRREDGAGGAFCRIRLGGVVAVAGQPRRPFQGWRYLTAADAPPDAGEISGGEGIPADMASGLRALGLL